MNKKTLAIVNANGKDSPIKLHENILDILFSYKNEIHTRLRDVRGQYYIDHMAIIIFNPVNEVVIFSTTPSVEYNLIVHDLWRQDIAFNPERYNSESLAWWDQNPDCMDADNLRRIKEINHNFTIGFNLYKKAGEFKMVYSFASRSQNPLIRDYYSSIKNKLFLVGDYSYKLIRDIYSEYCLGYEAPLLTSDYNIKPKSHLKLIVNNDLQPK